MFLFKKKNKNRDSVNWLNEINGTSLYAEESVLIDITELICRNMQDTGCCELGLSRSLGKKETYIKDILSGKKEPSIRELVDIFYNMGKELKFSTQ